MSRIQMKAIVIEDERLPRLSLIQKITEYHPDIEIVDQCEDAESAVRSVLLHKPDLLFLDIQLKDKDALWLLKQLENIKLPHIIFTTAYNSPQYLLQAIKYAAVDYLLKPIDIIELAQAIQKVRGIIAKQHTIPSPVYKDKTYSFRAYNSTLVVKTADIAYVKADGNYSNMFLSSGNEELIFERLGEIAQKLVNTSIIRAGKSHLINKEYIYKVEYKKRICILQTPADIQYKVALSSGGIEELSF